MNTKPVLWGVIAVMIAGAAFALMTPARIVEKSVSADELTQLQATGAWVIDVRTNGEYISGHIPSSLNVPIDQLGQTASGWSKDQPLVIYCATGARSAQAAAYLAGQGFKRVYDLSDGVAAWTGPLDGGQTLAALPTGKNVVKTNGTPVFIDFAGST